MDGDAEQAPLMGRVFEYSIRLASLHAVSREGRLATVTMADLSWGTSWVDAIGAGHGGERRN